MWFYPNIIAGILFIFHRQSGGVAGESIGASLNTNANTIFRLRDGSGTENIALSAFPEVVKYQVGEWSHLGFTFDGTTFDEINWFLNGAKFNTTVLNATVNLILPSSGFYFRMGDNPLHLIDCRTDEAALWNRKLSDDDMVALFNNRDGLFLESFTT